MNSLPAKGNSASLYLAHLYCLNRSYSNVLSFSTFKYQEVQKGDCVQAEGAQYTLNAWKNNTAINLLITDMLDIIWQKVDLEICVSHQKQCKHYSMSSTRPDTTYFHDIM
jgi:hypothetical protein